MQFTIHGWRWLRTLRPGEDERLLRHYLRLGPEGLARRFFHTMSEAALRDYIRGARAHDWQVIGWFHRDVLRGTAELFVDGTRAEAAFAVEPAYRRQGVGKQLLAHLRRRAQNRGVTRLAMLTERGNTAMLRLAASQGAALRYDEDAVQSLLSPSAPTPGSLILDLAEEETGLVASTIAAVWRAGAAWWQRVPRPAPPGDPAR